MKVKQMKSRKKRKRKRHTCIGVASIMHSWHILFPFAFCVFVKGVAVCCVPLIEVEAHVFVGDVLCIFVMITNFDWLITFT